MPLNSRMCWRQDERLELILHMFDLLQAFQIEFYDHHTPNDQDHRSVQQTPSKLSWFYSNLGKFVREFEIAWKVKCMASIILTLKINKLKSSLSVTDSTTPVDPAYPSRLAQVTVIIRSWVKHYFLMKNTQHIKSVATGMANSSRGLFGSRF